VLLYHLWGKDRLQVGPKIGAANVAAPWDLHNQTIDLVVVLENSDLFYCKALAVMTIWGLYLEYIDSAREAGDV
jgi:hypothetical protein